MKYLKQFAIILVFSFLGEILHALIPVPVPAAIYGLALLFLALLFKLIKPENISGTSNMLVFLLSLLFVAPVVNLIDSIPLVIENLLPIIVIIVAGLIVTFGVSGGLTQLILNSKRRKDR